MGYLSSIYTAADTENTAGGIEREESRYDISFRRKRWGKRLLIGREESSGVRQGWEKEDTPDGKEVCGLSTAAAVSTVAGNR